LKRRSELMVPLVESRPETEKCGGDYYSSSAWALRDEEGRGMLVRRNDALVEERGKRGGLLLKVRQEKEDDRN